MQVSFHRGPELRREIRSLPAELYRKTKILFSRTDSGSLFVPIRCMQYLAVIDQEEIIFLDGQGPRNIEISWQNFRTQEREDLRAPIRYDCIFYEDKGLLTMKRLQSEFFKALEDMEARQARTHSEATVTPLERP